MENSKRASMTTTMEMAAVAVKTIDAAVNGSDSDNDSDNDDCNDIDVNTCTMNDYKNTGNNNINNNANNATIVDENRRRRFAVLCYEQVKRLDAVMDRVVPIHGRGNFPTLDVKLKDLVGVVRARLEVDGIRVRDIRINGGAASHILAREGTRHTSSYNDLDLIFRVDDLTTARQFERVKTAVLESLLDFLPEGANRKRISTCSLKEAYVRKMVKVTQSGGGGGDSSALGGDRWSLITLGNHHNNNNNNNNNNNDNNHNGDGRCRNIELKFVDSMRRQFEFSVDSFQIVLDSLLVFYDCATMPMSDNFYPTVVGESVYGDFDESLHHLHEKLIATRNPEEIRGGGLLKYCHLLVRGYRPECRDRIKSLERYMCSRFFIDFSDLGQQQQKLENYLSNHFGLYDHDGDTDDHDDDFINYDDQDLEGVVINNDDQRDVDCCSDISAEDKIIKPKYLTYDYLMTLYKVVDESTVCLMNHDRRQTLGLIEELACQVYFHEQQCMLQRQFERQQRWQSRHQQHFQHQQQQQQHQQHHGGDHLVIHCQNQRPIHGLIQPTWNQQCTVYYAPAGYLQSSTGHHHHHHHHHHGGHQHHRQHQQPFTFNWMPCA